MREIYIFKDLSESLILELSSSIPTASSNKKTLVFIDDFCTLDEDFQETLLEYEVEEI